MAPSLGLESKTVRIVHYDDAWPALFDGEVARLRAACGSLPLALEHVGSTAVPGLRAKPVLDILAGHPSSIPGQRYIDAFGSAGYEYRGDAGIPGHHFFRRGQPRAYHIHLVEHDGALWREYLGFRDYLRRDPDAVRRYGDLKDALAARFPRDREAYTEGKAEFVKTILHTILGLPNSR